MELTTLSEKIRQQAGALGIDALGFAAADEFDGYRLPNSPRRNPRLALPEAKTIIVAGIYIGGLALPAWQAPGLGRTSRLYLSGFFNDVVKQVAPLAALLRAEGYTALICDDGDENGSIVPLKLAAIRAGFGWQGKNSLLVTKKYGTFLALGGIVTNADLGPRATEEPNRCKSCTKCQQACPTQALAQAHVLDRAKCLSHLLQHDDFPEAAKAVTENRVMDCESCQQACPWDAKHLESPLATTLTTAFQKDIPAWEAFFALPHLAELTEPEYEQALGHLNTGIPYAFFHRNVLMAMAHWRETGGSKLIAASAT
jgi:epoxyqueuosine reductase